MDFLWRLVSPPSDSRLRGTLASVGVEGKVGEERRVSEPESREEDSLA